VRIAMQIEYLAHSCFLIRSKKGTTVIIDPYDPVIGYKGFNRTCDALLISHQHRDHNYLPAVHGKVKAYSGATGPHRIGDITFRGVLADHDATGGDERGKVVIHVLDVDDMKLCHLGDLGTLLTPSQVDDIGLPDILFIPVGGHHTICAAEAKKVAEQLKAKLIVPMHYGTGQLLRDEFPLLRVDAFASLMPLVERLSSSVIDIDPLKPEKEQKVLIMNYTA
jgi:L-ascorbate metabolism protein UlaG (beta-lactamase superfamily)